MPTNFTIAGKALLGISKIAKSLEVDRFLLVGQKDRLVISGHDSARTRVIEGSFDTPGVEAGLMLCIEDDRFTEAAKPFYGDDQVAVSVEGPMMTLKVGRRRRTLATSDPRTFEISPDFKVPRNLPLGATATVETTFLSRCLRDSSGIERTKDTTGGVLVSIRDGELRFYRGEPGTDEFEDSLPHCAVGDAESTYHHKQLEKAVAAAVSKQVTLAMATDFPIALTFEVEGGQVYCLAAPMTEEKP